MSDRPHLRRVPDPEPEPERGPKPGPTSDPASRSAAGNSREREDLAEALHRVTLGDKAAFDQVYTAFSGPVFGLALRVLRDPAQAEEVAQEVLVEVWRTASRFDPARGSANAWVMTMAHRRAVDRVRSEQAAGEREARLAHSSSEIPYDEVAEAVEGRLEQQRLRHCMGSLTELQRESLTLAYYSGYTYPQVAELLTVPLGTVKTRMRDGLARLRDCLGVGG